MSERGRNPEVGVVDELFDHAIRTPEEHRRLLLDAMIATAEGKMNVGTANAIASLSGEVHKSIRLQWDMLCYAAENVRLGRGNQLERLPPGEEGVDDDA